MASARNASTDYDYDDRGRVKRVSYEELDAIRPKELAIVRRDDPGSPRRRRDAQDEDEYYQVRRSQYVYDDRPPRRRSADYAVAPYNSNRQIYDNRPRTRDPSNSDSDSEDSRERRRRRKRKEKEKNKSANNDDDDEGQCWYSHKSRKDANFFEKHLDSSYDGIIAAVAGGVIGGMTARRFGGAEHSKTKMLAGAAVGAASFNAAENAFRVFTEERTERKEAKWEQKFGPE